MQNLLMVFILGACNMSIPELKKHENFAKELFWGGAEAPCDKHEQIIREAIHVFMDKGYYKAKMEMIAQKVGIGKSTIYEYFTSKQQLFYETIFYVQERFYLNLQSQIQQEDDPERQLEIIIMAHLTFCKILSRLTEVFANLEDFPNERKEDILQLWQKSNDLIEGVLASGMAKGVVRAMDVHVTAQIITGVLLSAHVHFYAEKESFSKMLQEMELFIQKGIYQ